MKTNIIPVTVLIVLFQTCCIRAYASLEKEQKILESVLNNKSYNPLIRPYRNISGPVIVKVNMYIRMIDKVDDLNMEYSLQVIFRQKWKDERLAFLNHNEMNPGINYLSINDPSRIWTPDTFFSNEKNGLFHNIVKPNVYLRIYPDGEVLYSIRLSMKLSCPMDLKYYPMDKQTCSMIAASYGYTTNDLVYLWKDGDPIQVKRNLHTPHFTLEKFFTDYCTSKTNTGEYSCIRVDLLFRREFKRYFLEFYFPSIILVIISWICFWLDQRATNARVFIWMTVFLAFSIKMTCCNSKVPDTDYNTAYDTWTITCLLFLVAVILETVTVSFFLSGEKGKNYLDDVPGENDCVKKRDDIEDEPQHQANAVFRIYHILLRRCPSPQQKIDVFSRILFPLAFALFNLFYWCCTIPRYD